MYATLVGHFRTEDDDDRPGLGMQEAKCSSPFSPPQQGHFLPEDDGWRHSKVQPAL